MLDSNPAAYDLTPEEDLVLSRHLWSQLLPAQRNQILAGPVPIFRQAQDIRAVVILGIVIWLPMMVTAGALDSLDPFLGGLAWQSLLYSAWESVYWVGMVVALLALVAVALCLATAHLVRRLPLATRVV